MAGYLIISARVLSTNEKRLLSPIRRHKGDHGLGHTAVVYFTHGESPTYTRTKVIKGITIINMGAWDNNPLTIRAIIERIDEAARKD